MDKEDNKIRDNNKSYRSEIWLYSRLLHCIDYFHSSVRSPVFHYASQEFS